MGEEIEKKDLDTVLAEKLEEFYPEEKKEPIEAQEQEAEEQTTTEENSDIEQSNAQESDDETQGSDTSEEEAPTEGQTSIEEEKPEHDIDAYLHGYKKEFRELVKSIEDKDLQKNLINTSKAHLIDLDRQREDLGENKKLIRVLDEAVKNNGLSYNKKGYADLVQNYLGFDALFTRDPQLAIKNLAKSANINLDDLVEKKQVVEEDDYDYRTPEEKAESERVSRLEEELNLLKRQNQQQHQVSVQQEINDFANARNAEGELKYPHFDKVRGTMGLLFNDSNPDMTMEKAYQKAVLLDDELRAQRDADLLRKNEEKRKKEIEKAKSLKKQSVRSSRVNTRTNNPDANMDQIVASLGF